MKKVILFIGIIIIIGAAFFAGKLSSKYKNTTEGDLNPLNSSEVSIPQNNTQSVLNVYTADNPYIPNDPQVKWKKWSNEEDLSFMKEDYKKKNYGPDTYYIGDIISGKYEGYRILYAPIYCEMGCVNGYILKKNQTLVLLQNPLKENRDYLSPENLTSIENMVSIKLEAFSYDPDFFFSGLINTPKKITDSKAGASFFLVDTYSNQPFDYVSNTSFDYTLNPNKKVLIPAFFDQSVGQIYKEEASSDSSQDQNTRNLMSNGIFIRRADGIRLNYVIDLPFLVKGEDRGDGELYYSVKLLATFSDGSKPVSTYNLTDSGGCGAINYISVVNIDKNDLVSVGKTNTNQDIYELKNDNHPIYQKVYDQTYKDPNFPQSLSDFIKKIKSDKGLLFTYDVYGRLIKMTSTEYVPAGECGKPVIYLYPQKAQNINVKVFPKGGFTKTDPLYPDGGWNVYAKPTGELLSLDNNKTYPYLFWEGRGGLYSIPEKGWSVARSEVPSFLNEKLTALGLNIKEKSDFIEFWLPRMKNSPYYFITFMGTNTMDEIAPLDVSPRPDTVIRVLMDFKELDHPTAVSGFTIHTPERKGFTLVEWGGVINK